MVWDAVCMERRSMRALVRGRANEYGESKLV